MTMPPVEPSEPDRSGPETSAGSTRRGFSRRAFVGGAAATAAAGISLAASGCASTPSTQEPGGFGSVSNSPRLPAGFERTFTSRFINANGLRQHAVVGGDGPPLLLVHGWPQNWYAWRLVMPKLAQNFTVMAVDQRGIGLTDKPTTGYDTGTIANDLIALMAALGHQRFAVVGTDSGMPISYALASDHPDQIAYVALAEVAGPSGAVPSPPLYLDDTSNLHVWHIPFNRVNNNRLTEQLVRGREEIFFGYEFDIQAGTNKLPRYAIDYYVRLLSNPESLRGTFEFYRAWGVWSAQNAERAKKKLTMPVLGIGGAERQGTKVGEAMKPLATNVQTVSIPGAGHWFAEQAPDATVAALTEFLAPYRTTATSR